MSIAGVFGLLVFLIMVVVPLASGVLLIVFSRRRGPDQSGHDDPRADEQVDVHRFSLPRAESPKV